MSRINKKKKIPILYKIFAIILTIVTIFLLGSITRLNILNLPLLILVIAIITIVSGFIILLMLKSRKKKLGFLISLILIFLFSVLSFYINKTTGLLTNLDLNYKTYNYSVIVLKDSPYKKINDINNQNMGYYNNGEPETEKAITKITKKIEIEKIGYEDTHTLANALLEKEVEAILIEDSYLQILSENIKKEDKHFNEYIKNIYNFTIITNTSDISKDINVTKEPFNIYLSGIDTYGEISSVSRSDVNMVVSINPDTRQILLTSIPRDYYVQLHGKSGHKDKLTHAGLYGTDMSIQTLEDLLDIEINYYIKVNFSSVIDIINAIDGITVYSDYTFTSMDHYTYTKGYNKVNGEEALSFARERKAFLAGDRQRVKNQQAVFKGIFDKCTSKSIITKYSKLLDSLHGSFVTNIPTSRITSLIRLQLAKNYSWNIVTNSLEGTDSSNYTYSAPLYKAYVMEPKEESLVYAKELLNKVITGKILDEELMDELNNEVHTVTKTDGTEKDIEIANDLQVKLVKENITLIKGEDYIYHGYMAYYNGKDITNDSEITETFKIKDETFDNYKDLVRHISYNLEPGNYIIEYNISYKEETITVNQNIIIKEPEESINLNQ